MAANYSILNSVSPVRVPSGNFGQGAAAQGNPMNAFSSSFNQTLGDNTFGPMTPAQRAQMEMQQQRLMNDTAQLDISRQQLDINRQNAQTQQEEAMARRYQISVQADQIKKELSQKKIDFLNRQLGAIATLDPADPNYSAVYQNTLTRLDKEGIDISDFPKTYDQSVPTIMKVAYAASAMASGQFGSAPTAESKKEAEATIDPKSVQGKQLVDAQQLRARASKIQDPEQQQKLVSQAEALEASATTTPEQRSKDTRTAAANEKALADARKTLDDAQTGLLLLEEAQAAAPKANLGVGSNITGFVSKALGTEASAADTAIDNVGGFLGATIRAKMLPGAMNNEDRKFIFEKLPPNRTMNPEQFKAAADIWGKVLTRNKEKALATQQWIEEKGSLEGFDKSWQEYIDSNSLFAPPPEQQVAPQAGGMPPGPGAPPPPMQPQPAPNPAQAGLPPQGVIEAANVQQQLAAQGLTPYQIQQLMARKSGGR